MLDSKGFTRKTLSHCCEPIKLHPANIQFNEPIHSDCHKSIFFNIRIAVDSHPSSRWRIGTIVKEKHGLAKPFLVFTHWLKVRLNSMTPCKTSLGEDVRMHVSFHVSQPKIAASVSISQAFVIQSHEMKQSRM